MLAYPSSTTARYLIFVAALICSGLFVGNWVHNDVRGDEWAETVKACGAPDLPGSVALDDFATVVDAAAQELRASQLPARATWSRPAQRSSSAERR